MTKHIDTDDIIKDCEKILDQHNTPKHVMNHCRAVTDVSLKLTKALNDTGFDLDEKLITRAAMLHDIKRTEKNHAKLGADIVKEFDEDAADIISKHMTYHFKPFSEGLDETDIVCLGDKLVKEDEYVGFKKRMTYILDRFRDDKEAFEAIKNRMKTTERLLGEIEQYTGSAIDDIVKKDQISLDTILKKVEKPGRYIGGEINSETKELKDVDTRFAFAFPDVYEIGMSYTGLQLIYGLLNGQKNIFCERVFAPANDMEEIMREYEIPLFTLETQTNLKKMDILGFTLQYELSYSNIINMMDLAGIPVLSEDRDDSFPLVVAGGPCVFNPEVLADMFDIMLIGDGEEILIRLCEYHQKAKNEKKTKEQFLKEISALDGVYVPSFYEPEYDNNSEFTGFKRLFEGAPAMITKCRINDLDNAFFPHKPLVPLIDTVHNRSVMEIFRGCGRGCRFCQAGMIYRPVRERSIQTIIDNIETQLKSTGHDEVSLLSLSSGDYTGIEPLVTQLIDRLDKKDVALSLPSMRLDSLNPSVLHKIGKYRKSSLTFAPEAGSQRLRDVINKNITESDVINMVEKAIELNWNKVKLYFMIGLPTETYEDLDGMVQLVSNAMAKARSMQEKGKRNFNLTVSVSNFVPKPNTPFQWCQGNTEKELLDKNYYLKDKLKKIKGVSFQYHDTRPSHIEMLLAKGDRRTLKAIIRAVELGCKFDSWREFFKYDKWIQAFDESGISTEANQYTNPEKPLPWDIIDMGVSKDFLIKEYDKALKGEKTDDCRANCSACGLGCEQ